MIISDVKRAVTLCLHGDVVPELTGHTGIGKTEVVRQLATGIPSIGQEPDYVCPYTEKKGLSFVALYCATQEVADLIGYPIKVWETSGNPVVEGVHEAGKITTAWAKPSWWPKAPTAEEDENDLKIMANMRLQGQSEEEIRRFWDRPRTLLFLDEVLRSQREVLQALYPMILTRQLHTHQLPRGTRIVCADNPSGAYDVKEPDHAFLVRLCHIEVETNTGAWYTYAMGAGLSSRVTNFVLKHPQFFNEVPKDLEKAVSPFKACGNPRNWDAVDRIAKVEKMVFTDGDEDSHKRVLFSVYTGLVGVGAAQNFIDFKDDSISLEDVLTGKVEIKNVFAKLEKSTMSDQAKTMERKRILEKIMLEVSPVMKNRPFNEKEAVCFRTFLVDMNEKEKATAALQTLFIMKNNKMIDGRWTSAFLSGGDKSITSIIQYLMAKKGFNPNGDRASK